MRLYSLFLENFLLPLGDLLNNSRVILDLNKWREFDTLDEKQLKDLSDNKLKSILLHAKENSKFYSNEIAIKTTENINTKTFLESFPIMDKQSINENLDALVTKPKQELVEYNSSGSSGIRTTTYMSKSEQSNYRAIQLHWWNWAKFKIGEPIIQTGITPQRGFLKSVKDMVFRTTYINAFNHNEKQLLKIAKQFEANPKRKYALIGYASSLFVIANFVKDLGLNVQLKTVISLGDKMFQNYRKLIEEIFDCKVYDTYGCNEGFMIASEYDLPYKYIMTPHVYVEILDENGNEVDDGQIGYVVVTKLDSYSMPLIRYKNGDLARKLPRESYPPERKLAYPLLQEVIGRVTDIIITPNGSQIVVHAFTGYFEYISEIKQFKILQYNLDEIEVHYNISYESIDEYRLIQIKNGLKDLINDPNLNISWVYKEEIKPAPSGKTELVKSFYSKKIYDGL